MAYCAACGHLISDGARFCRLCGASQDMGVEQELQPNAAAAQKAKLGKGVVVIILLVIIAIGIGIERRSTSTMTSTATAVTDKPPNTDSIGRPLPDSVTNDAELLLYRCGTPSKDDSTEYDDPRPQIPSRTIEYRKAHLRFAFLPPAAVEAILNSGGNRSALDVLQDVRITDPPPYKWKQFGLVDMLTNKAISAGQLKTTLSKRLPCFLGDKK